MTNHSTVMARLEKRKTELEAKTSETSAKLANAQARLKDTRRAQEQAAPPMAHRELLATVASAGAPEWLAVQLITAKASKKEVEKQLSDFSGVQDACTAAGIENPDLLCKEKWGDLAGLVFCLVRVAQSVVTDRPLEQDDGERAGTALAINPSAVYANRKQRTTR